MKVRDVTGKKELPIMTIIRESIGFFKRHALEALSRQRNVRPDEVFWVLTVPAIWGEPAKELMRGKQGFIEMSSASEFFSFLKKTSRVTCIQQYLW